jgi:hypothetical protein
VGGEVGGKNLEAIVTDQGRDGIALRVETVATQRRKPILATFSED